MIKIFSGTASLLIAISISAYLITFNGGLSDNHTKWGEFGAYIAGTLGTFLTLSSIIMVYIFNKNQITENNNSEKLTRLETRAEHILNVMYEWSVKNHSMLPALERLLEDLDWQKSDVKNSQSDCYMYVRNEKLDKNIVLKSGDAFVILSTYISLTNKEKAKKALIDDDISFIKTDLDTFKAQAGYLVEIVKYMMSRGYDIFLARHMISIIYARIELLHSIEYVDENLYHNIGIIQSLPKKDNSAIMSDVIERLTEDLNSYNRTNNYPFGNYKFNSKEIKFIDLTPNNDSALYSYVIKDCRYNVEYKRSPDEIWVKVN